MLARFVGRRLAPALVAALLPLTACGPQEPPAEASSPEAASVAATAESAQSLKGIFWPNLMLMDGEDGYGLAAVRPDPAQPKSRFRIHLDVNLGGPVLLDSLRGMLQQGTMDGLGIRKLLTDAATAAGVDPAALALIAAIPFRHGGNPNQGWPRHDLFTDYGATRTKSFWYRMQSDFVVDAATRATIEAALAANDPATLKAAVLSSVNNPDPEIVALVNAVSIRP